MTTRIDAMEREGLVRRLQDPGDRRIAPVELTEHGRRSVDRLVQLYLERQTELLDDIFAPLRAALERGLKSLIESVERTSDGDLQANHHPIGEVDVMHALEIPLRIVAAGLLGLLVGALLAEGALLVPHWRQLEPDDFYTLHKTFGPALYRFYAPLTIAAISSSTFAALASVVGRSAGWTWSVATGTLGLVMLAIYFTYFKRANQQFADEAVPADALPLALHRWAVWHWSRVSLGLVAFASSLAAIAG